MSIWLGIIFWMIGNKMRMGTAYYVVIIVGVFARWLSGSDS